MRGTYAECSALVPRFYSSAWFRDYYPYGNNFFVIFATSPSIIEDFLKSRFLSEDFDVNKCLLPGLNPLSLPFFVNLKRFFALLFVLSFGIMRAP
jgi:hypothetical protein